jgi:site-specific DNA-methyltransferase (adenine-specific)
VTIDIHNGDCLEVLKNLEQDSIDACITDPPYDLKFMNKKWDNTGIAFNPETWHRVLRVLKPGAHLLSFGGSRTYHRMACAVEDAGFEIRDQIMWLYGSGFPKGHSALKPAHEPIILARKPLEESTVTKQVLATGTGGLNINSCRVGDDILQESCAGQAKIGTFERYNMVTPERIGRWPANVIHDGSEEVLEEFVKSGERKAGVAGKRMGVSNITLFGLGEYEKQWGGYGDFGTPARFFYCAKASTKERNGSKHPTVKPLKLMQYLVRLITPPGGTVLDPFAGTGATGEAYINEGFNAILIEKEQEYIYDINKRLESYMDIRPWPMM